MKSTSFVIAALFSQIAAKVETSEKCQELMMQNPDLTCDKAQCPSTNPFAITAYGSPGLMCCSTAAVNGNCTGEEVKCNFRECIDRTASDSASTPTVTPKAAPPIKTSEQCDTDRMQDPDLTCNKAQCPSTNPFAITAYDTPGLMCCSTAPVGGMCTGEEVKCNYMECVDRVDDLVIAEVDQIVEEKSTSWATIGLFSIVIVSSGVLLSQKMKKHEDDDFSKISLY